ncbi:MAG: amidophosphoribosyltransferase, partial [Gemmatimonadaceae bacterium]
MCGIFGVYGNDDAAAMAHLGLYSLQHRGQESSGIVAVDPELGAKAVKRMGLVSEAFAIPEVQSLRGNIAIGHTRYSTAGSSTIENAQPVLVRFRDGHIALAHNGNLTNATELRRDLENEGSIFMSTMDSEVLVHRMAHSSSVKPEDRLADALRGVEGAYCLVVIVGNTLLAARDPRGWRPLVMGKLGDATVFASESCALDLLGATLEREVECGEIIAVDANGTRSMFPLEKKDSRKCVFEYVYFSRPDSQV